MRRSQTAATGPTLNAQRSALNYQWCCAVVAGLFALHPLHVESVAWVSERKDVLSTFFGLLSLLAYARYAQGRTKIPALDPRRSTLDYSRALLFFALGLMSKPMLVTLPFIMLLLDYWPLGRIQRSEARGQRAEGRRQKWQGITPLVLEKIPFFVLSAASCVVTLLVQSHSGAVRTLAVAPMGARVENAFVSVLRYLGKTFWPADLAVIYPRPEHWPAGLVTAAAVLAAGVSLAAWWFARRAPFLTVGWFWFLGALVPVIGLVQVGHQSMADRYAYVPSIGLFIALAWGAAALLSRWRMPAGAMIMAAGLVLGACGVRTFCQTGYWRNSGTLFQHALALTQNNYLAHDNLGIYLFNNGDQEGGIAELRQALAIKADDENALNSLAAMLASRQQYAEAEACAQKLLRLHPNEAPAHFNYGVVLAAEEKWDSAAAQFAEALRLKPDFMEAQQGLEVARQHSGK